MEPECLLEKEVTWKQCVESHSTHGKNYSTAGSQTGPHAQKAQRGSRKKPLQAGQFSHSIVSDSATPWTAAHQASPSITNSQSLLKLMSIESVMPSNHLILCRPLLLLPSIFPSIRVFLNESVFCIKWPKYSSCSFNISPSNEYSGLIYLLVVQETLKSLLQCHSSKASILQHPGW